MKANFTQTQNKITQNLEDMVSRGKGVAGYLNRVIYKKYQNAQKARWMSEGGSQDIVGAPWKELSSPYKEEKKKRFAGYAGGGNAIMIATGKLADAATGRNTGGIYKITTNSGIEIGINLGELPYAKYPGTVRPFMEFDEDTIDSWKKGIRTYMGTGRE